MRTNRYELLLASVLYNIAYSKLYYHGRRDDKQKSETRLICARGYAKELASLAFRDRPDLRMKSE